MTSGGNNFNDFPESALCFAEFRGARAGSAPSKYAPGYWNDNQWNYAFGSTALLSKPSGQRNSKRAAADLAVCEKHQQEQIRVAVVNLIADNEGTNQGQQGMTWKKNTVHS